MAYCKKCGAYIPIGETACPACGYDPEAEERQAREQKERQEEEARRKKEAEEAAEKERREKERRSQQQKTWAEQERRRREREKRQGQNYTGYTGGSATQSQYSSQQTTQNTSQNRRTGWTPPWKETQGQSSSYYDTAYAKNKAQAQDSAANQHLSILSYLGPLFMIPLFTRPNDDFARFHANQGLNLLILNGLLTLLGNASGLIPTLGGIFSLYCTFKGIGNVLKGKKEPLPLIGTFRFLK